VKPSRASKSESSSPARQDLSQQAIHPHSWRGAGKHASRQGAEVHLARYPVDAQVPVYFDPEKPSDAVLTRTAPGASAFLWVGAAILALVLVAAIMY
jgi:hypothetical protein